MADEKLKKLTKDSWSYRGGSSNNVQPDWKQDDPKAADYIKNRTHWESITNKEITFIEDAITMNFDNTYYSCEYEIPVGAEVDCYIDGTLKHTVTTQLSGTKVWASFTPDFSLLIDNAAHQITFYNGLYSGLCKFVARYTETEIKQLDEKYISLRTDPTFSIEGKPADAKAVGKALGSYITDIDTLLGGDE